MRSKISLKFSLGKLLLENTTPEELAAAAREMSLEIIGPSAEEAASFHKLPRAAHRDPFDGMLAWKAIHASGVWWPRTALCPNIETRD